MKTLSKKHNCALNCNKFLNQLEPHVQEVIKKHASLIQYEPNENIFEQNSTADKLLIITQGIVKHYILTPSGKETYVHLGYGKYNMLGLSVLLQQPQYLYSLDAVSRTNVIAIPTETIYSLRSVSNKLEKLLLNELSKYIIYISVMLEQSVHFSSVEKLVCFLSQTVDKTSSSAVTFKLPFKKQEIAARIGIRAETFSRALYHIKKYGIVISNDTVTIDNPQKISQTICSNCSKILINKHAKSCPLHF